MRVEFKKISGVERISCYKNLDPEADVFPDVEIEESTYGSTYLVDIAESASFRVNSKETALKIAELYINDLEGE